MLLVLFPLFAGAAGLGDGAPEFRLKDLEGRKRTLADLREGGPILLNFGSVFCASCQEALRRLEEVRRELGPRGLRVAAVNLDPPKAARAVQSVVRGSAQGIPWSWTALAPWLRRMGWSRFPTWCWWTPQG